MKKVFLAGLAVGAMMVGMTGVANATFFTSTTDLNRLVAGNGTTSWTQAMPGDFQVPYDIITDAKLTVHASFVDGNNDTINVEGIAIGRLQNQSWTWVSTGFFQGYFEDTTPSFDISSAITPWTTGDSLSVSLNYRESWSTLWLDDSVLEMNYTNAGPSAVPEPGTMLLFGTGIAGLAAAGRRRITN